MSLRARLLIVVTALTAAGLIVAGIATHAALRSFLVDRVDSSLAASERVLQESLEHHVLGDQGSFEQLASLTPDVYIQVRDGSGAILVSGSPVRNGGEERVPELPATTPSLEPDSAVYLTVGAHEGTDFRARIKGIPGGGTLIVAAPLDDVEATLHRLALIEALVALAVLGAVTGLGIWLVRVGLRPLGRIEDTAAAIGAGDLSRRIENDDEKTEVGRLGQSLNAMLGQIEAAFADRTASEQRLLRFVADASHELRTPLSAVRAYAELFERGARTHPDDLERAMAGIQRESIRMGVLVDDLLLLARLDQGRPLEHRPVDLSALARDAVDTARAVEPERQIELTLTSDELVVTGDPDRLRQVLDNLLANVRAHTAATAKAKVHVSRIGDSARIDVTDDGPGLGQEEAARVFERFYRVDPARSRDSGGSGLGLAIVTAIVEAQGGRASVMSAPGEGSTFRIELPVANIRHLDGGSQRTPSEPTSRLSTDEYEASNTTNCD